MYFKIIRNDIAKSKLITLTTLVFIAASAMLVSLTAILSINLFDAIDTLMFEAKTPHFMQMHSGELDTTRLAAFAKQNEEVEAFQTFEFINIDSAQIIIGENSLSGSVQDNGFCTQGSQFDYLLDLNNNVITASDGEVYVPICYWKDGTAKLGDTLKVYDQKFTVAGFLRDSQMNSLLASSKRFLISNHDFAQLKNKGSIEYLIEFRIRDLSALGTFENVYTAAGFEANGPTLTYPLFRSINAISDGLMIAVILLVSVLIVIIAFLCIRFTLLAKIEDDYREIGVMKAIGLRLADIRKIYLAKYTAMAAAGSALGYALSFVFRGMLLENIRLYMGESRNSSLASLIGFIGVLLVMLAIIVYVRGVLKRFRKISAAEAIRFGSSPDQSSGQRHFTLNKNRLFNTNVFLGIKDVLSRKKLYLTMLTVLVISAFIMIVPLNLYNTISSKNFVQYMGIGNCDLRIDLQQTDRVAEKAQKIANVMENDESIVSYVVLTTRAYQFKTDDGTYERIKVEFGDHSVFPIKYSAGKRPNTEEEIALSSLQAEELGKKTGDSIILVVDGQEKKLLVCGIYSDITNGGKTAKAVFNPGTADIMWSVLCAELADQSLAGIKVREYAQIFDFAKVSDIDEYIRQTFGPTMNSIATASYAAIAVAIVITILITLLFIKMLIAKERYGIAVMKAFGFTNRDIKWQYVSRSLFVLLIGLLLGIMLSNTLGELLAGKLISSFGASSFQFEVQAIWAYLLCPLLMSGAVLIATMSGTSGMRRIKISGNIKE